MQLKKRRGFAKYAMVGGQFTWNWIPKVYFCASRKKGMLGWKRFTIDFLHRSLLKKSLASMVAEQECRTLMDRSVVLFAQLNHLNASQRDAFVDQLKELNCDFKVVRRVIVSRILQESLLTEPLASLVLGSTGLIVPKSAESAFSSKLSLLLTNLTNSNQIVFLGAVVDKQACISPEGFHSLSRSAASLTALQSQLTSTLQSFPATMLSVLTKPMHLVTAMLQHRS